MNIVRLIEDRYRANVIYSLERTILFVPRSARSSMAIVPESIKKARRWGQLPRKFRRKYHAQNGICPYCGEELPLKANAKREETISKDHVIPKSKENRRESWLPKHIAHTNIVLCHPKCNNLKGNRYPKPCEIFFSYVTDEIDASFT